MQKTFCLIILSLLASSSFAQVYFGQAQFQTIQVDPLITGLGGATIALQGYAGAAQINPATIGKSQTVQIGSTFDFDLGFKTNWIPGFNSKFWYASPSLDVKINRWAFAYAYKRLDLTNYGSLAQDPDFGSPHAYDFSHKFAFAFDWNDRLTAGAAFNVVDIFQRDDVDGEQRENFSTISFDLGLYYNRLFDTRFVHLKTSAG